LRGRSGLQEIPAVILTTSSWVDESTKLAGFDREAFFQKPSLLEDWIAVARAIDVYRMRLHAADPPRAGNLLKGD
jgi:hypothetical protein